MHPAELFEVILGMLVAVTALYWVADRFGWPPSTAIMVGGGALAFIPGVPAISLNPDLVLVLFLPPLIADGAWNTEVARFRRHLSGILWLAFGAVIFSTLVVAFVAHWLVPSLPWAACAALGAIVSPPDAISARAVLQRVALPRRLGALLEGESLLNDATGLVIFRFAVAAAMGSAFEPGAAIGRFVLLVVGGIAVGLAIGTVWGWIAKRLSNDMLLQIVTILTHWIAYVIAESIDVSGVIAVVVNGLVLGWKQHIALSAAVRMQSTAFWQVMVFLLEASVFILIGFSLRDVLARAGGFDTIVHGMGASVLGVILALTVARFVYIYASDGIVAAFKRLGLSREGPIGLTAATVMGWAGMRGVVTLAAALTLPATFPGRDFILVTSFGVILVTVLVQGSSLGVIIRSLGVRRDVSDEPPMDLFEAEQAMTKVQHKEVERLAHDEAGNVIHPQLLRRYAARSQVRENWTGTEQERTEAIESHFGVVIAAVAAGRKEVVRLHRSQRIDDETLRSLERDLDLEELGAISARGGA